ncbi:MAG TPA: HEAT repeat domain-containing protein [Anaerolineaceae bacterium]
MPPFLNFTFNQLSFWLGFLAATIFWWLVKTAISWFPSARKMITALFDQVRIYFGAAIDQQIRSMMWLKAEKMHLASSIFGLDEILIKPSLLAPPPLAEVDEETQSLETIENVIPYLPDEPQLTRNTAVPRLSLAEALQGKAKIAVIGAPGMGKTTSLADLTINLSMKKPGFGILENYIPLLFHILEFLHQPPSQDIITTIFHAISGKLNFIARLRLQHFIKYQLQQGKILFLIDGLDELAPEELPKAVQIISTLVNTYPAASIAVSCSKEYFDGLGKLNFYPLGISGWDNRQRYEFLDKWNSAWQKAYSTELKKTPHIQDTTLYQNWLRGTPGLFTPLEWTLLTWAVYNGDMVGNLSVHWIQAYVERSTGIENISALDPIANDLFSKRSSTISQQAACDTIRGSLGNLKRTPEDSTTTHQKKQVLSIQPAALLGRLIDDGVLINWSKNALQFKHIVIASVYAGKVANQTQLGSVLQFPYWDLGLLTAQYSLCFQANQEWVSSYLAKGSHPLYQDLFAISKWTKYVNSTTQWRNNLMKKLIDLFRDRSLPISMRARSLASLVACEDPAINKFLSQSLTNPDPVVRVLSILGISMHPNPKSIPGIIRMTQDDNPSVRTAAIVALGAFDDMAAVKGLVVSLTQGDEMQRRVAAEVLASNPKEGHAVLEDAISSKDILTRRAVVCGLVNIRNSWSETLLNKIAVEDSQWVVRNAAVQGLETLHSKNLTIPHALPEPTESPWLIQFAGKQGLGISKNQPATDMLRLAFTSGNRLESRLALEYLKTNPDEMMINQLNEWWNSNDPELQETAVESLRYFSMSGYSITLNQPA